MALEGDNMGGKMNYAQQSEMIRGRLREVVAEIEPQWGLQINRSAWISYAAISEIEETSKGQKSVLLNDGTIFKIANSRKKLFEHGCDLYAPGIQSRPGSDGDE